MVIITNKKVGGYMTTCIKRCNAEMLELYENYSHLINVIKLHLHNRNDLFSSNSKMLIILLHISSLSLWYFSLNLILII